MQQKRSVVDLITVPRQWFVPIMIIQVSTKIPSRMWAMPLQQVFPAGMGNMEGTCGALVGAGVVLGLATKDKAKSIKTMRQIMTQFQQRNGATQCRLLKGVGTGKVLRECPLCVADAAEFLEEQLDKLTDQ